MKHLKILNILTKEMTTEEIAKESGLSLAETRRFLLRLLDQGKIESVERDGKIFWKLKEKSREEEEFKYL
ncbi:winged helix-turn-helix transcriptional regulator [Thermococcus sp. 101 C5]|uniref:winged helix-turn-helix transcriptional regulator n=1 Tax=Thermococcus sp. 101 C5 TaxID=2654197 RepID=UPI00128CD4C4|nr:winged helix-turn-helix transcriptional regulator [Thermococcus sp. 101 C5]MPW38144.1 winged helix-turn-helix transcriptional regulator [Thermococcus sp. 101 C5]